MKNQWFYFYLLFFTFFLGCVNLENTRTLDRKKAKELNIKPFKEIPIQGDHSYEWKEEHHPFVGAAAIDIDKDGIEEIFVGGQYGYKDWLFSYDSKKQMLVDIIDQTSLSSLEATHGANATDMDGDGDIDLILSRSSGVYLFINEEGQFTKKLIPMSIPKDSIPMNVAIGDIDKDGDGDLYVSFFVNYKNFKSVTFNDSEHSKKNILLLNNGDLTFQDITESSGTASLNNTFVSSFIDLDDDGHLDLVVAQNTGQVELFRNEGDLTFSRKPFSTRWGFWMGLAVGDIDEDGDSDLFFSNSGTSVPKWILNINSDANEDQVLNTQWALFRNDGEFQFTEITEEKKLDNYGFGWGAIFEDITLSGDLSLLVAKNYIKWPFHQPSFLRTSANSFVLDKSSSAFYQVDELGLEDKNFTQSPLIVDINQDGKPDVFWVNMGEQVGRAFINQSDSNFVTLKVPDHPFYIGTKVQVTTQKGRVLTRRIYNNTGLSVDHTSSMVFGMGPDDHIEKITVWWPDGSTNDLEKGLTEDVIEISHSIFIQTPQSVDIFEN